MPAHRFLAAIACLAALGTGASAAYTVRAGDTLSGIAGRLGVSVGELASANGITDPNRVFAGRTLSLPGAAAAPAPAAARSHKVARGENLTVIARRYGVSVRALADANRLDARRVLRLGADLVVPVAAASGGSSTSFPSRLQQSPERLAYVPIFKKWAAANHLPADLLMATTWLESGWQNHVVSSVGARGIGQLMPRTTEYIRDELIGVPSLDPAVPEHNIRMSARYLRWLIQKADGDVRLALASYYQGPHSVRTKGPYPSTIRYVDSVLGLRSRFAG